MESTNRDRSGMSDAVGGVCVAKKALDTAKGIKKSRKVREMVWVEYVNAASFSGLYMKYVKEGLHTRTCGDNALRC